MEVRRYVQGFFDAEESVNLSNKIAEFYQKNTGISKLLLIKDLLNQLGIKTSKIYTHSKNR
jgi:intein-encoded DNA endonuclease-like protein